ncbi:hypothetical protein [Vibrio cyclitrophicus]|uniref:hypothetical protein n=1 Tax=Vibrio cyclitrophicus TaxID=47951 RepID=UPI000C85C6CE|nr:hypothetical protein [Vibrio cyclitrophicus]PME18635.1 hypothetical protein BCV41_09295 [Vibrio cyclitrophicus]
MIKRLPISLLAYNHSYEEYDEVILIAYNENKQPIKEIAKENSHLLGHNQIDAIKKVAKILYANGIEPILTREWDSSKIMGYVGEALTELTVPGKYVAPGNKGFDIDSNGELIEVKTSISTKFSMSKHQYETANFLVTHRFHKDKGYIDTHFYPMEMVKNYKPLANKQKRRTVSVDLITDEWAKKYPISLQALNKFFKYIEMYMKKDLFQQVVCDKCLQNCSSYDQRELEEKLFGCDDCKKYCISNWYDRYCNFYIRRRAKVWFDNKQRCTQTVQLPFTKANQDYYWSPKKYQTQRVFKKYPSRVMANVVW